MVVWKTIKFVTWLLSAGTFIFSLVTHRWWLLVGYLIGTIVTAIYIAINEAEKDNA